MKSILLSLISLLFFIGSIAQNQLPNNGRIGIGTTQPRAMLDVNGTAAFRDTTKVFGQFYLSSLSDTSLSTNRLIGVTPEGTIGYYQNLRNDSLHATKRLRVGNHSMYLEEGTGGENYFYATDYPLEINPEILGVTLQNTFINPDGGSLMVGYATDDTAITTATLSAQTLAGSSICGKASTGVAICAEVTNTSGILFRGAHSGVNEETIEIDSYGKIWSWGGIEIGENAKGV